jgi:ssRNA-specific RNase YbeY (16S rRNA maturation enzyme)
MKASLLILIVLHGLIHLLGFAKAFNLAAVNQLTQSVSKIHGMIWLASAILFFVTAVIFFRNK